MTRYDALAVVEGTHETPPSPGMTCVSVDGVTVLLSAQKRKAILLPQTRKQALQNAASRQADLEAAMAMGTVLAFRAQTSLTIADVAPLVRANRPLIDTLMARFSRCVQFQITVSWMPQGVLAHFRQAPELQPIFAQSQVSPAVLECAVERLAARLGTEMSHIIAQCSQETLGLPRAPDMLMNSVVLVPAHETARLDKAVETVDAIWSDGLRIRQIGPATAASFALLDPRRISSAEISMAREMLSLRAPLDEKTLAQARRKALVDQPQNAEAIRSAGAVLESVLRVGAATPFYICNVLSEDQSAPAALQSREVA